MSELKSKIESLRGRVWHETVDDLLKCLDKHDEKIRADAIEEFRKYLKTVIPCEMPQEIWNMGVDNTCDRMLKEQKNE